MEKRKEKTSSGNWFLKTLGIALGCFFLGMLFLIFIAHRISKKYKKEFKKSLNKKDSPNFFISLLERGGIQRLEWTIDNLSKDIRKNIELRELLLQLKEVNKCCQAEHGWQGWGVSYCCRERWARIIEKVQENVRVKLVRFIQDGDENWWKVNFK